MELCENCHAGCCRRYNVYLWGSDILRICQTLKVDISFFVHAYHLDEEKLQEFKGQEPIFIFTDAGEVNHFILIMKSVESKYFPGASKCVFLQEWSADALRSEKLTGIVGRCGIYGIRPVNCRAWPAGYDEKSKSVIIKDPALILDKKHKRVNDNHAFDICDRPLNKEDLANYQEGYFSDAVLNYHEKQFFMQLAEKWNQNPDISDKFQDFLMEQYANRINHITKE